jgi:anthranilate/para-aminobenzoate synthase component I
VAVALLAGEVYQVNLAHTLMGSFAGEPLALFGAMARGMRPRHGVHVETAHGGVRRGVLSASPELFLAVEGGRVVTRPMKGTRRVATAGEAGWARAEAELKGSAKDAAELDMIVDLMRNDLGRVARRGSVRVEDARMLERHAGALVQGVATVSAEVGDGCTMAGVLAATFPPGSVTGAPKVRAVQLIRALEDRPRGPYCGAAGWVDDLGRAQLNVAIRTALVTMTGGIEGEVCYPVGAGIVADSDPRAEWRETLDKGAWLRALAAGLQEGSGDR